MADIYNMGQIRFQTSLKTMNDKNFTYKLIDSTQPDSANILYEDIILYSSIANFKFESGKSYYLRLGIPRDAQHDMQFDLKLYTANIQSTSVIIDNDNLKKYQNIKRFKINKDTNNLKQYSEVILYESPHTNGVIKASVVAQNSANSNASAYKINNKYYAKRTENSSSDIREIVNKNVITLAHSWLDNSQFSNNTEIVYKDFIFSNKTSLSFNAIKLELYRNDYDEDIIRSNNHYGVVVNTNRFSVECYELINIINNITFNTQNIQSFNTIGVWGHPGLLMGINGEEIRIGQSGYYELNNFDITNFGIVVRNNQDKFILDYQYKNET